MISALFLPARLIVCSLFELTNGSLTCYQPSERSRSFSRTLNTIKAIGKVLISQKKSEILTSANIDAKGGVEKRNIQGRDLLSLLIKANVATDIPDSARMSDEDILARESALYAGQLTQW